MIRSPTAAALLFAISNVLISSLTEVIVFILQALAPAKANPFSSIPFLALFNRLTGE